MKISDKLEELMQAVKDEGNVIALCFWCKNGNECSRVVVRNGEEEILDFCSDWEKKT